MDRSCVVVVSWLLEEELLVHRHFGLVEAHAHTHLGTITFIWFARQQSTLRLFARIQLIQPKQLMHWYWGTLKRSKANETKPFNARWTCLKSKIQSHREQKEWKRLNLCVCVCRLFDENDYYRNNHYTIVVVVVVVVPLAVTFFGIWDCRACVCVWDSYCECVFCGHIYTSWTRFVYSIHFKQKSAQTQL